METIVYFTSLAASAYWMIHILNASNLEKLFKPNHIWQIRSAYVVLSLGFAHLLAEMVVRIFNLF